MSILATSAPPKPPTTSPWYNLYLYGYSLGFSGRCLAHIAWVKVYTRCIPADCLLAPPPALEEPVCRLCCCSEACLSCRTSSRSPLPLFPIRSPPPANAVQHPVTREAHLKAFAYWADTGRWLARLRAGRPQGSPTNGDCGCVTHRERTSRSTTLLLFLLQTAAIALSFFIFFIFLGLHLRLLLLRLPSFVVLLCERGVGPDWWSTPFRTALSLLWMQCGL